MIEARSRLDAGPLTEQFGIITQAERVLFVFGLGRDRLLIMPLLDLLFMFGDCGADLIARGVGQQGKQQDHSARWNARVLSLAKSRAKSFMFVLPGCVMPAIGPPSKPKDGQAARFPA